MSDEQQVVAKSDKKRFEVRFGLSDYIALEISRLVVITVFLYLLSNHAISVENRTVDSSYAIISEPYFQLFIN